MAFRPPIPGLLVDNKYRLAERIGGGGMGDVFRADNVLAGRPVAIKFLRPELALNAEVSQRFFQEAQAVNRIRHANVVEVLDAGVGEMGPYIVMEFLDGESVGLVLSRVGRFEFEAAIATTMPVLEALEAAHRVGIIHRDLKPENVFIALDSARTSAVVRLLDFGIAKMLDSNEPGPRTRTGVVFGTPDYLSPEQATGEGPLDGRSDLFSVGVLLYELLSGLRPFRAPTAVATAFKIVHAEPPSLASTGIHVDSRLEAVVHRLLQKDPAKRFATAQDVTRELDRLSPDPVRRSAALGRIISPARRPTTPSLHDSERSLASLAGSGREGPRTRRLTPSLAQLPPVSPQRTAQGLVGPWLQPDTVVSRAPESPRAPWLIPSDFPKTARSPISGAGLDSSPSSRTSVRPFPVKFAGRFRVRGPVLGSVDRVILDLFGPEGREGVVAQMPEDYAAEFRSGSINALVAYDLAALDAYMEYASAILLHDFVRWREIGRLAVDGELQNVVRTLLRPTADLTSLMRRGISTWARLFSFGQWRVGSSATGKVTLTIGDFDAVALPLRLWIAGVVEQTVRRAVRGDLRATITSGDQEFMPDLVFEIA